MDAYLSAFQTHQQAGNTIVGQKGVPEPVGNNKGIASLGTKSFKSHYKALFVSFTGRFKKI